MKMWGKSCRASSTGTYHVAQVPPLVEKVAVDIDAVGLGEVF
jgi:hypothetical protein